MVCTHTTFIYHLRLTIQNRKEKLNIIDDRVYILRHLMLKVRMWKNLYLILAISFNLKTFCLLVVVLKLKKKKIIFNHDFFSVRLDSDPCKNRKLLLMTKYL